MFNFALSLNPLRDVELPKLHNPLARAASRSMGMKNAQPSYSSALSGSISQKPIMAQPDLTPFLEMSQDFMIISDASGQILHMSASVMDGLNIQSSEGMSFLDLFHADDRPHIRSTVQQMMLSGAPADMDQPALDFEARLASAEGNDIWAHWTVRGAGDQTYCMGRNITQEKAIQAEITLRKEQLIQAESIGRFGRWQWTIGESAFDLSSEIYRIFGQDPDSFTPDMDSIYAMLHDDDKDRMDQTLQRAVINQNAFDVDFCMTRPDGEQRFIRCEGRCATDEDGDVVALYGIMQDMSERIMYERDLRAAKESAEKACAARTKFLANMSHELRTPLNAIIGFSEMIEGQYLGEINNQKYIEYGTNIRESGAHLLDLIGDILDMAKIEAGKYDLDLEDVAFNDILNSALTMVRPRADEKNLTLAQDIDLRDDLMMKLDRRACLQVMLNVLSNAVKFTPDQGQISITAKENKHSVTVTISDNGIGIPAMKLASITNPFEQVSSHYTRDHEGSGLGLAITKELVELHGGTLKIKSQIDVGTDVIITLPLSA